MKITGGGWFCDECQSRSAKLIRVGALSDIDDADHDVADLCLECAEKAVAMLREARSLPRAGWQPIETAPKDGTWVLLYEQPQPGWSAPAHVAQWSRGEWQEAGEYGVNDATHWQPLPEAP